MLGWQQHLTMAVHGGADSGGGFAGSVAGWLAAIERAAGRSPGENFADLLPGIAAMENWHPLLVHFPIALLLLFVAIDIVASLAGKPAWRGAASWFLYAGTLFAAATVAAGLIAAANVAHGGNVHEIMEKHEHLGISVLVLAALLSVWRIAVKGVIGGPANQVFGLLAMLLAGLLVFTADLGGLMVYKFGVAVRAADPINQGAAQQHRHEGGAEDADDHSAEDHGGHAH
ncbi:DUF2231 domain-containing protein [Methylomonas sp. MED-D]|uniref:DUF2231 domain-containing protein n=1 Tax=unclassified Methylomonas TaxID=2608980 RepID=UPI00143CB660|nr:DUF2231 domain-containing protein [Methylomonas sp. MV1]MDT4329426.1 DUF2231 domain-containing protein [Methylomonas sp. MV1]NJA08529.1 DUF2231 domain-containing protein [Methylococcaceae bacterium WWC4]